MSHRKRKDLGKTEQNVLTEYLGIVPYRGVRQGEGYASLTFRHGSLVPQNRILTAAQLIRLRNDINFVLHNPESVLYTPEDVRSPIQCNSEGFDNNTATHESPFDPA